VRLADLTIRLLREALRIYEEVAYEGVPGSHVPEVPGDPEASIETVLGMFVDETPQQEAIAHRYVLRLGNRSYPFMKFVLEEHLIRGEFFLLVDTHDQMFPVSESDRREVEQLRRGNAEIKRRIEKLWAEASMPTVTHLRGLIETRPVKRLPPRNQRILIVDDDPDAAETLSLLLEARGFDVETVHDGRVALERVDPRRHDLILMDVEMPVMNGLEACQRLKADESRAQIPVLLATAGAVDLSLAHHADAFLVKPFQAEILFSFLDHLLRGRRGGRTGEGPDPAPRVDG
jgi:CheY-like chemotaxis protein